MAGTVAASVAGVAHHWPEYAPTFDTNPIPHQRGGVAGGNDKFQQFLVGRLSLRFSGSSNATHFPDEDAKPMTETTPSSTLPDRLSNDPRSPFYNEAAFERDVGIRVNGKEYSEVIEYCVSEGWVKIPAGKTLDRRGFPLLIKLKGTVEAFYK